MILYKAVKYMILEKCLEVLFDTLFENVNAFKIIYAKDLCKGMFLSKIKYGDLVFNNCEVLGAHPDQDAPMLIYFRFRYESITNEDLVGNHQGTIALYGERGDNMCSTVSILDNRNFNHRFEFIP